VLITCPAGQYRDTLKLAMEHIDPASLGIEGMTARRAAIGAQIFEIGGPEHHQKADALAERIRGYVRERHPRGAWGGVVVGVR